MLYSLLAIVAIALLIYSNKQLKSLPEVERNKKIKQYVIWGGVTIVLLLVISGRTHWLMGVLATLAAVCARVLHVAKYIPIFKGLFGAATAQTPPNSSMPNTTGKMDAKQAADILGIDENATKEEITRAHKRLMQKLHPDRGGSDALAVQINQAKEALLKGK